MGKPGAGASTPVSPEGGASVAVPRSAEQQPVPVQADEWAMVPEDERDEGLSVATKQLKAALMPSAKVRQEHEDTNHAVYREWCPTCVAARATGQPHRRQNKTWEARALEKPKISSDYFYMNDDEQSMPHLAVKFSRSGSSLHYFPPRLALATRFLYPT